jgi:hypothetical protein
MSTPERPRRPRAPAPPRRSNLHRRVCARERGQLRDERRPPRFHHPRRRGVGVGRDGGQGRRGGGSVVGARRARERGARGGRGVELGVQQRRGFWVGRQAVQQGGGLGDGVGPARRRGRGHRRKGRRWMPRGVRIRCASIGAGNGGARAAAPGRPDARVGSGPAPACRAAATTRVHTPAAAMAGLPGRLHAPVASTSAPAPGRAPPRVATRRRPRSAHPPPPAASPLSSDVWRAVEPPAARPGPASAAPGGGGGGPRRSPDFYPNVGRAIRVLREDLPALFERDMDCERGGEREGGGGGCSGRAPCRAARALRLARSRRPVRVAGLGRRDPPARRRALRAAPDARARAPSP